MNNAQMIQQVQSHIENLRQEKKRIELEINAAQNYLNVLQGNSSNAQSGEVRKGNQTDEARERMKKAQQERQERERNLRLQAINQYLNKNGEATTQEIATFLKLKEHATKRYLRLAEKNEDIEEIRIGVWKTKIPF